MGITGFEITYRYFHTFPDLQELIGELPFIFLRQFDFRNLQMFLAFCSDFFLISPQRGEWGENLGPVQLTHPGMRRRRLRPGQRENVSILPAYVFPCRFVVLFFQNVSVPSRDGSFIGQVNW